MRHMTEKLEEQKLLLEKEKLQIEEVKLRIEKKRIKYGLWGIAVPIIVASLTLITNQVDQVWKRNHEQYKESNRFKWI